MCTIPALCNFVHSKTIKKVKNQYYVHNVIFFHDQKLITKKVKAGIHIEQAAAEQGLRHQINY